MLDIFQIGHFTDSVNGTGCTVILPPERNVSSACAMGASPGTREYALLSPKRKIESISGLLLTGGSAFGLHAAQGVVEGLEARNKGYYTPFGLVPIVPAAVIFDLNIGSSTIRPTAENGRQALEEAVLNNDSEGCIGAGTGATVGKWNGMQSAMKGGIGIGHCEYGDARVTALMVVNAVGDIVDKGDQIIAGALGDNGQFLAKSNPRKRWGQPKVGFSESTILGVLLTNCLLSKQNAAYVSQRAHLALAKTVAPSHTQHDGDVIFAISAGDVQIPLGTITEMAREAVESAVLRSVQAATSMLGVKARKDL